MGTPLSRNPSGMMFLGVDEDEVAMSLDERERMETGENLGFL